MARSKRLTEGMRETLWQSIYSGKALGLVKEKLTRLLSLQRGLRSPLCTYLLHEKSLLIYGSLEGMKKERHVKRLKEEEKRKAEEIDN